MYLFGSQTGLFGMPSANVWYNVLNQAHGISAELMSTTSIHQAT